MGKARTHIHPIKLDEHERGGGRAIQSLLQGLSPSGPYSVACIRTPAGGGSPEGLHTHSYEQIYYLMAGSMAIEIDGEIRQIEPETIVAFPAGTPHRNWNAGSVSTVHLAIQLGAVG